MLLGRRVKEARECMKFTQNDLASKLGVSKVTICGYEKGKRYPSLAIFIKLLDALQVTPDYLLGRDTVVSEQDTEYKIIMSKEDIKILNEIKSNNIVYNRLLENPKSVINFISKKLN
ncbi:MAG: helix-turn-helix domain-containing protein [Clostridium sp.]|nr:helix-turn-helix domain-containing protein [Clostridium sp.]MCM1444362.1 helix-turn-helix domain-containing protein [Candidatus Amulumruptor caecigallinarius]